MKFLDLFAGIGGFRLGLESAGHECVGFCEIDKFARASYKAIHNTEGEIELHDITSVPDELVRKIGHVDIICGGFPCQAFSIAGKRGGFEDTRGTLFFEIARFASILKPKYIFCENVKGLLNHDKGRTFKTIINTFDELGYDVEWQMLNSKDFGVPQNRERVYIVGHLRGAGGRPVFPIFGKNGTTNQANIKQIGNINNSTSFGGNPQTGRVYDIEGISPTLNTMQGGGREPKVMVIDDQGRRNKKISPKNIVPTLRAQSHGNEPKVTIPVLTPDRVNKRQNGRRFKNNGEPMFTLTAQDRHGVMISVCEATKKGYAEATVGDYVNLEFPKSKTRRGRVGRQVANTLLTSDNQGVVTETLKIRKLTPRECWRLQGFPDWSFDKAQEVNSKTQLYKQAGNSVTVNVIKAIGERLEE